ncbi:MAG: DUF4838 domain-containing protein [Oscillospiraceae bacterium]|jgi:hypothetical protein|nr:DUF4838 domain-containing protein [Oscillospiraceae bacterium]
MNPDTLTSLTEKAIAILNALAAFAAFVVNPFIGLFWPDLPEFVPVPVPPAVVDRPYSLDGYRILYDGGVATDKTAAEFLARTLNEIAGGERFEAVGDAAPAGADEFLIGAISGADIGSLGDEGYLIRPAGTSIAIAGGKRGAIYGVYRFLEKYFDCRWYAHDFEVIPSNPEVKLAAVAEERYVPPLEYRETDWISPRDKGYSVANRLNGNSYRSIPAAEGGTFGYCNAGFPAHSMLNEFLKPAQFFAGHPDWYAWRDDQNARVARQLCLTNPEVLAQMKLEVGAQIANGNGQAIITVTQDDNQEYCQCKECKRVDAEEGSHAGTMIRFVNEIAKEFPDTLIDTFAYQYTRTPPKIAKPLPNVVIRLCSIECCFAHPLDDPGCSFNAAFANDIKGWKAISNHLYIWDYTTDYGHYNCYFPNFGVLQRNMQFFVKNNVKGIYEEGNHQAIECDSEFADLRSYLLARLMWDPDIDYGAEMNGFLKAYYGGGWQYLREFIDLTSANAGTKPIHRKLGIFNSPTDKDLLNMGINKIRYADALWEKAVALAGDEKIGAETREQRVRRSQLSWRFWKGCNKAAEFWRLQPAEAWQAANEALYDDLKAFGVTRYSEGANLVAGPPANWWGTPMDWRG